MLQGFSGLPMNLTRIAPLIITNLKLKYLAKTKREREATIAAGQGVCPSSSSSLPRLAVYGHYASVSLRIVQAR